jgi:predicted acylesterase/phospholipase RssA
MNGNSDNNKTGLVLTGGGSRGAFSIGALKYLILEQNKHFDIISGVSVGAINASFLSQYSDQKQGIKDLEHLWLNIETEDIYKNWFPFRRLSALWKKSLYNSKPMRDLIDRSINVNKIRNSGNILLIGSVCADTSLYRQADQHSEHLLDSIKASASIPLLFEPHRVESDTLDVDGGIRNNAPISAVVRMDADHITIICSDHLSLKAVDTENMKSLSIAKRSIDIMADEVINNDINMFLATNNKVLTCQQHIPKQYHDIVIGSKRYIPNIIIKPSTLLVEDSTIFDPREIRRMIDEGYETAKLMFNKQNK